MRRILILGAGGMLGYTLLRRLGGDPRYEVHGTVRGPAPAQCLSPPPATVHAGIDMRALGSVKNLALRIRPAEVINCVGLIKQLDEGHDPVAAVEINALLPHKLASICTEIGARLVHFSTDCVFDGQRGGYRESDRPDADDLYGLSKRLGEVDYEGHLTLRTSMIGHELRRGVSLVDWFLARRGNVRGYRKAIFSGLPTVEIARVLADRILTGVKLGGLYHLAADPIDKDRLLRMIAAAYEHDVPIVPVDEPAIDRSLSSARLREAIGYRAPAWVSLIGAMHDDYLEAYAPGCKIMDSAS